MPLTPSSIQISAGHLTAAQDDATALWHNDASPLPDETDTPESLALRLHRANFDLWHEEDKARDPHATAEMRAPTLDGWFIDILPDLNQDDEEVARYLIQNTLWWVGIAGLDGIRQDTLPYVPRRFWREWKRGKM